MSIHISCDRYLRLELHVQIRLYHVLPYKAKMSAQQGMGFILDRCVGYLGLTMPSLQTKRLLIFEIINIKNCTFFFNRVYEGKKQFHMFVYVIAETNQFHKKFQNGTHVHASLRRRMFQILVVKQAIEKWYMFVYLVVGTKTFHKK